MQKSKTETRSCIHLSAYITSFWQRFEIQQLFNPWVVDGSLSRTCAVISSWTGFKSVGFSQNLGIQSRSHLGEANDKKWAHVALHPEEILPLLWHFISTYANLSAEPRPFLLVQNLSLCYSWFKDSLKIGKYISLFIPSLFCFLSAPVWA